MTELITEGVNGYELDSWTIRHSAILQRRDIFDSYIDVCVDFFDDRFHGCIAILQ